MSISLCEDCVYYSYDEESDSYYCDEQLDEDEMASFLRGKLTACPYVLLHFVKANYAETHQRVEYRHLIFPVNEGEGIAEAGSGKAGCCDAAGVILLFAHGHSPFGKYIT